MVTLDRGHVCRLVGGTVEAIVNRSLYVGMKSG